MLAFPSIRVQAVLWNQPGRRPFQVACLCSSSSKTALIATLISQGGLHCFEQLFFFARQILRKLRSQLLRKFRARIHSWHCPSSALGVDNKMSSTCQLALDLPMPSNWTNRDAQSKFALYLSHQRKVKIVVQAKAGEANNLQSSELAARECSMGSGPLGKSTVMQTSHDAAIRPRKLSAELASS
jgi:hypothetical protein